MALSSEARQMLVAYLKSDPAIAGLVGTRIYPDRSPLMAKQNRIEMEETDAERPLSNDGPTGLCRARITLWCDSLVKATALQIAQAVKNSPGDAGAAVVIPQGSSYSKLHGFRGTVNGVLIQMARLEDERDAHAPPVHADDKAVYWVQQDWTVWFNEP
jgi:hypothetical protein